jgi:hypothetical protein
VDGEVEAGLVVLDLKKDGSMSINEDGYIIDGSWDFSNDKEDLRLTIFGEGTDFKIRRLTNKELWLENELEDNELSKFEAQ